MKINHSFQINSLLKLISKFYKKVVKWALTKMECSVVGTTTLDRECSKCLKLYFKKATHENLLQFLIFSDIVFCFSFTIRNQK
jgi:hypothetical protein